MPGGPLVAVGGGGLGLVLLVVVLLGGGDPTSAGHGGCGPSGPGIVVDAAKAGREGTYSLEQLRNAAAIMNAGQALGLGVRDQTIGVMTALGESGLRVLDRGDQAGPDSRGLFQQRGNGAWGSYADRMDPAISSRNFFLALRVVAGRELMPPTSVAHAVQRNADPFHYERFWDPATRIVTALADASGASVTHALSCTAGPATGPVSASGWTRPHAGRISSPFGMRVNPVTFVYRLHGGIDFAGACDSPIRAAAAGTVVDISYSSGGGHTIVLDHGQGITTRYLHMYPQGVLAQVGQRVSPGTQIGRVGSAGNSTGCHLHFEVRQHTSSGADKPIDPVPFLTSRGVPA